MTFAATDIRKLLLQTPGNHRFFFLSFAIYSTFTEYNVALQACPAWCTCPGKRSICTTPA